MHQHDHAHTSHSHASHSHDHASHDHNDAGLAELLDLDGQVLHAYWAKVLDSVQSAAPAAQRVLDLGAGTGVGTIGLAQRFGDAEVVAVDVSAEMLARIEHKADTLGLSKRVKTMQADLDQDWPAVDAVDVTWASLSMHHLADPDRVLRDIFTATRPGGIIAIVEMDEQIRFLPNDLGIGRPGLESRCVAALGVEHAQRLPELGSHWAPRLSAAGFASVEEQAIAIEIDPPHQPQTAQYAQLWLARQRSALDAALDQDDLATLDLLIGDGSDSVLQRDDLRLRGSRSLTVARR